MTLVNSTTLIPEGYTTTSPTEVMNRKVGPNKLLPRGIMIDPEQINWKEIDLEASRLSEPRTPLGSVKLQFTPAPKG